MVNKGGLQVYTTLSLPAQIAATAALQEGLRQLDKRQGYRGPLKREGPSATNSTTGMSGSFGTGPLREGEVTEAVVTKTAKDGVTVQVRDFTGRIALEDLQWARRRLRDSSATKEGKEPLAKTPLDILKAGDVIEVGIKKLGGTVVQCTLEQTPLVEGALLSVDPRTGAVLAMVGGYDFRRSEYNRTVLSRRQPGSAFKPIIYATAVNQGLSPGSPIVDSGVVYNEQDADMIWKPENYDQKFFGQITLRDALAHSRNSATVRLLESIGVRHVLELAKELGIASPLAGDLSLALGSSGVTLQELTAAYGTFFNQGIQLDPYLIESVVDANGTMLDNHIADPRKVVSLETAYIISNMMEDVVQRGTAQAAKGMGRPLAGKTGTTNDFTDAWFIGGAPNIVTGVWVGFDELKPIGEKETGAHAALPIWMDYMKTALKPLPVMAFTVPEGVVFAKIDPASGLLAPDGEKGVLEVFLKGTEPTRQASVKGSPSQFFKFDQM
jgi:penicillin-binding protein 1A